jgi:hypothetical protein
MHAGYTRRGRGRYPLVRIEGRFRVYPRPRAMKKGRYPHRPSRIAEQYAVNHVLATVARAWSGRLIWWLR